MHHGPTATLESVHTSFQFSPDMTTKTVSMACGVLSKLVRGTWVGVNMRHENYLHQTWRQTVGKCAGRRPVVVVVCGMCAGVYVFVCACGVCVCARVRRGLGLG
eukprot:scaffold101641_cov48-Phaeocystis_antarctica.AAC.2